MPTTDWAALAAERLPARLLAKINQAGPVPDCRPGLGPCWLWLASTTTPDGGYGRVWDSEARMMRNAHRVVLELLSGPLPAGYEPDHLCLVLACVNPGHLEVVTMSVNRQRQAAAGTGAVAVQRARTRCPMGHPYDLVDGDGHRRCRDCRRKRNREAVRRYQARKRAAVTTAS